MCLDVTNFKNVLFHNGRIHATPEGPKIICQYDLILLNSRSMSELVLDFSY